MDYVRQAVMSLSTSGTVAVVLNHMIQVYCFTYSILCLLTAILTTTNFIYADALLKIKPIGVASFILFWSMKLWTSFDSWMIWVNVVIAAYIALYFYDSCCNIAESIDNKKETTTTNGTILLIVNILSLSVLVWLKKSTLIIKNEGSYGIFGQQENYIYIALVLIFFGINLYRMQTRSLFPVLINVLILTVSLIAKQMLSRYEFTQTLPIYTLIYLPFIIDAQGREYLSTKNQAFHRLFMTVIYFYGFVITNQPDFHHQYIFLAVSSVLMLINR